MERLRPEWVWTPEGLHRDRVVVIRDDVILGVECSDRHPEMDREVDRVLPGCLLVPGFVNAHSHAFQRAFRGHVQWTPDGRDDFWSWRQAMYATATSLSPEGVEAVSRLAFLEMAESGITHVGEFHYLHHQPDGRPYADREELARRVIAAALEVGLRITLLRVVYARSGPDQGLTEAQRRFGDAAPSAALTALERLATGRDPRVTLGLAPHSVRAVPGDWLSELASWEGVVHAHVAEQPREVEGCQAEHGRSPLAVFDAAGLVSERFTAVHLTWPSPGDVDRLVAARATVCACPTTELDLGDGFLPLEAREVALCVGSDSQARIDLLAEARALELHARGLARRRNVLAPPGVRHGLAERLLSAATGAGSRSLGAEHPGIVPGAPADLVALDLRRPAAAGVPPLEATVFHGTAEWVRDVWVAGRRIVTEGRHPGREAAVRAARPFLG